MKRREPIRLRSRRAARVSLLSFVLVSLLVVQAKATGTGNAPASGLVWPPAPDEPRIAYVQSISKPADVGARLSGFRRFSNWISGARQGNEPLNHPFGLALDDSDNLCMTDTGDNAVSCFDNAARRWYRWEQVGNIRFASPVAVAKKGKTVFVADSAIPVIVAFDLDGKILFTITEQVTRASGLAISGDRLLVADVAGNCIVIFDLHGKFLSRFGRRGADAGEFNFPTHVTADSHGDIYVTDSMNSRIQVFDASGKFQRQIGAPGDGPGSFSRPKGVAVDALGHVYVVDALFDNFQIFDAGTRLLLDIGHPGSEPGEFWLPNGIAVGRDNRIYIADSYNGRVQVFKTVGKQ